MAASQIGHGQIGKIIEDMEELLPFVSVDRADYRACRTTYGCLSSTYKRSNDSSTPEKEYKELQALEKTLRHRLSSLDADRGLPRKFKGPLDDLKSGVDGALECGVSTDFLIQGLKDALEYKPDATPAPKPVPPKMVSEKQFKTVLDELRNEKEKNRKLNEENNRMALELKQYQMRERSAQTGRRPGAGFYQDYKDTDCSTYFDVNCTVHAICSAVHQKRTQVERGYQ